MSAYSSPGIPLSGPPLRGVKDQVGFADTGPDIKKLFNLACIAVVLWWLELSRIWWQGGRLGVVTKWSMMSWWKVIENALTVSYYHISETVILYIQSKSPTKNELKLCGTMPFQLDQAQTINVYGSGSTISYGSGFQQMTWISIRNPGNLLRKKKI